MLKKILSMAAIAVILTSCVSGHIEDISNYKDSVNKDLFLGKSIGVEPFGIDFSSTRFVLDLRGLSFSINGQEVKLPDKYITEIEDERIGLMGLLEVNPLKKTNSDKITIQKKVSEEFIKGLKGEKEYHIPFFNGFGEGNSGFISSRPLMRDPNSWAVEMNYLETFEPKTYFSEVRDLATESREGLDYILKGTIDLSNEVVEILEELTSDDMFYSIERPKKGGYYLLCKAYIWWELVDAKTGDVVLNYKTKSNYKINDMTNLAVQLPVANGDINAFNSFFRNTDLTQYAMDEVLNFLPLTHHFYAPFYEVTNHWVSDK